MMTIQEQLEDIKRKLCCKNIFFYNSNSPRPTKGKKNTLYIDSDTNIQYLWDGSSYTTITPVENKPVLTMNFLTPMHMPIKDRNTYDWVLEVSETNSVSTSGDIVFRYVKDTNYSITYDPAQVLSVSPNCSVDNALYSAITVDNSNPLYTLITIPNVAIKNKSIRLGFKITVLGTGAKNTIRNFSMSMMAGSGGVEVAPSVVEKIYIDVPA